MKRLIALFAMCFVLSMGYAQSVEAACCERPGAGGSCDDGSKPGTGHCCGVGKCNIFCCKCKGGCRKGDANPCSKCDSGYSVCSTGCDIACSVGESETCLPVCLAECGKEKEQCKNNCQKAGRAASEGCLGGDLHAFAKFHAHDENRDGRLSREEVETMVKKTGADIDVDREFKALDANRDGHLSLEEAGIEVPPAILQHISRRKHP